MKHVYDNENLLEVLAGGDQLTVTRARSAIGIRRTHETNKKKLRGLVPVVEDWHARMTLMTVSMHIHVQESALYTHLDII